MLNISLLVRQKFAFAGDAAVNEPSVSVESSQLSSEVLVTQVHPIMLQITFVFRNFLAGTQVNFR